MPLASLPDPLARWAMTPPHGCVDYDGVLIPVSSFNATLTVVTVAATLLAVLSFAARSDRRGARGHPRIQGHRRWAGAARFENSYRWT